MKHEAITEVWEARSKLRAAGRKLYGEGHRLRYEGGERYDESNKLHDEGDKLYAESNKLHDEGDKLYAESRKLYLDAVTAKHGDKATINWETGEITTL